MEEGRAAPSLTDSLSQELNLFEEGITKVCKQLSSDHQAWFKDAVERIRRCALLGPAIEFERLGKVAQSLLEESDVSSQRLHERSSTLRGTTEYQTSLLRRGVKGKAASSTPWRPGPQHEQCFQAKLNQGLLLLDAVNVSSNALEHEVGLLSEVRGHLRLLQESPKDAGDEHAANALELLDGLLQDFQKRVRCIFRDIVLLACTRFVDPNDKESLQHRLRVAFGRKLDRDFLARLLNSRHQLFGRGRKRCLNRLNEHAAHPTTSDGNRETPELEPYPQSGSSHPPDLTGQVLPLPKGLKVKNTFIETDTESERALREDAASEMDLKKKKWPNASRGFAWRPLTIDDLKDGQREEAWLVMELLSSYFDPTQMKSIKCIWAELFACHYIPRLQYQHVQNVNIGEVVTFISEVIDSLGEKHSTVAHCCTALSQLAASKVEVAHRVVSIIVNVIGAGIQSVRPIELLRIFEVHKVVLGVATTSSTIGTHKSWLKTMKRFLSTQRDDSLRSECVRVLTRCQPLPDLIDILGGDESLWETALDEVYTGFGQQITSPVWSSPDCDPACALEEEGETHKARKVLLEVSRQLGSSLKADPSGATLVRWAYSKQGSDQHIYRFKLIGILFGVQRALLVPLFAALVYGQEHGRLDEDHVTSIFRALIELEFLELVPKDDANEIVIRLSDQRVRLLTNSCISAFVSVLASLGRHSTSRQSIEMILEIGNCYANYDSSSGVLHESLWALSILFEKFDGAHALCAITFAKKVRNKYSGWGDDESESASWSKDTRGDEYNAWRLATTLLDKWRRLGYGAEEEGDVGASSVDSAPEVTRGLPPLDEADSDES